jgi:hypothetical protein
MTGPKSKDPGESNKSEELDLDAAVVKDLEPEEENAEEVRGGVFAVSATWCPGSSCYQAGCGTNSPTYTCNALSI